MDKKWIWILVALVVVIGTIMGLKKAGIIGKEEGTKVSVEKVTRRNITEVVNASGKVYPEIEVKISPDVSGEIVELTVMEGDSVRRGQLLARVYADILATQRDQAAAVVNQQQAQVGNVSAALEAFKARMEQAERQYQRQKQLYAEKVISRLEFEQAENAVLTSRADYNAAQKSIQSTKAAVASAQASLQRTNKDLSRTSVLAPMDGVVSLLNVKKGERVVGNSMMAGTEMLRIADMRTIEVRVDVGENDIPKVSYGDTALVEVDAYSDRKFKGIVTQIASTNRGAGGSVATSANDVTNYEVRIRLLPESYADLLDPARPRNFPFRPGMSASADIQTNTHVNVLAVPINAVTTRDKNDTLSVGEEKDSKKEKKSAEPASGEKVVTGNIDDMEAVVFVLQSDGKVRRVRVRTDIQDISHIEVVDGLKEGDQVVTGPYAIVSKELKNGMAVKVVPKEELFEVKK
ncbi:MAG: efflux RND transporter periplasmic adaptor subunit [Chitinophagaceae bacterium]|jgi:HlyD family secretion protein|nr:efflux RND transporter periplasmic adaptor subunit [Chitinophagaceae bacterium]